MNKKVVWVFVVMIGLLGCFRFGLRLCSIPKVTSPYGSTIGGIYYTSMFFGMWLSYEGTEGASSIDESIPLDTIVQAVSDFVDKKYPKQKWVFERFHAGDAWGQEYNIEWRSKVPSNADILLLNNNPILIWSSGANGFNEFGGGDDICDEIDWRISLNPKPSLNGQMPNSNGP